MQNITRLEKPIFLLEFRIRQFGQFVRNSSINYISDKEKEMQTYKLTRQGNYLFLCLVAWKFVMVG